MKKTFFVIITFVIILTIATNISAATFSDVLITYLVDPEFGTVISVDDVSFAINEDESGTSGALIFTIPKVVEFAGDNGVYYRSPIVDASFGQNIIKFQYGTSSGPNVEYSGTIINGGASYIDTLESGDMYVITFQCSPWNMSNIYYKVFSQIKNLDGFIYVHVKVKTEQSTDDKIFEYLTGNHNSPEISKGNADIGGALDALNPLGTGLSQFGDELNNSLNESMNGVKNNASIFKTPLGKVINILGLSLSPLFDDGILFFLIMISIITIVIIAVLRKAGD